MDLVRACQHGDAGAVAIIIERPDIDPNATVGALRSLEQGPSQVEGESSRDLLPAGLEAVIPHCDHLTPLCIAAALGHLKVMQQLLGGTPPGADVNASLPNGVTPLWLAAAAGQTEAVDFLLANGAHPNPVRYLGVNDSGITVSALWQAARSGFHGIVAMLVQSLNDNHSLDAVDEAVNSLHSNDKVTSLWIAAHHGHEDVVKVLLDARCANLEVRHQRSGATALFAAARNGHKRAAALLLDAGADPEAKRDDGHVPLTIAADKGQYNVVELLLDRGVDPLGPGPLDECEASGEGLVYLTAADLARRRGHNGIASSIDRAALVLTLQQTLQSQPRRDSDPDETLRLARATVALAVMTAAELSPREQALNGVEVTDVDCDTISPTGRGCFGTVCLARLREQSGAGHPLPDMEVVIKTMRQMDLDPKEFTSSKDLRKDHGMEYTLAMIKRCPFVIRVFNYSRPTLPDRLFNALFENGHEIQQKKTTCLVMERCDSNLKDFLETVGDLDQPFVLRMLLMLALGLRHISHLGYILCDIKAENVLVTGNRDRFTGLIFLLSDHGLASRAGAYELKSVPPFGSSHTRAPEVANPASYVGATGLVDLTKADVWSLGGVAWQVVTGSHPFVGALVDDAITNRNLTTEALGNGDMEWVDAIVRGGMLVRPPEDRLSPDELVDVLGAALYCHVDPIGDAHPVVGSDDNVPTHDSCSAWIESELLTLSDRLTERGYGVDVTSRPDFDQIMPVDVDDGGGSTSAQGAAAAAGGGFGAGARALPPLDADLFLRAAFVRDITADRLGRALDRLAAMKSEVEGWASSV